MYKKIRYLLLAGVAVVANVSAQAQGTGRSETICRHIDSAEKRTIWVEYAEQDALVPCRVVYEKNGEKTYPAEANNEVGYCEKTESKIVANLRDGEYRCTTLVVGPDIKRDRKLHLNLFEPMGVVPVDAVDAVDVVDVVDGDVISTGTEDTTNTEVAENSEGTANIEAAVDAEIATDTAAAAKTEVAAETGLAADAVAIDGPQTTANTEVTANISEDVVTLDANSSTVQTDSMDEQRYWLISRTFDTAAKAHQQSAAFKRIYPNVNTRVAANDERTAWFMVLGEQSDQAVLQESLLRLNPLIQNEFELVALANGSPLAAGLSYEPDGWMPYALLECYNRGRTSTRALSACSNVQVDAEAFINCVGGGRCSPEEFDRSTELELVDMLEIFGNDDPATSSRGLVLQQLDECRDNAESPEAIASCAVEQFADPELVSLYQCQQDSSDNLSMVRCMATDELMGQLDEIEQCSGSKQEAVNCILAKSDQPALVQSAECLALESPSEAAFCAVENNLAGSEAEVASCLQANSAEGSDVAQSGMNCLPDVILSESNKAKLDCVTASPDSSESGLCLARQSGQLSVQQLASMECMADGDRNNTAAMANCVGGQFVSDDIGACLEFGMSDPRCFEPVSSVSRALEDPTAALLATSQAAKLMALRDEIGALSTTSLDSVLASDTLKNINGEIEGVQDALNPDKKINGVANDTKNAIDGTVNKIKDGFGKLFGK